MKNDKIVVGMNSQRLYVTVDSESKPSFHLPWNYHLSVQSFIYDALGEYETEIAAEQHQFPHAPPWSYSNFIQTGPFQATKKGLTCSKGYFVFTSDNPSILNAIANFARHNQELKLGHTVLPVSNVEVESINGASGQQTIETVSPIAISEESTETPRDWYRPNDPMWFSRVKENVQDRMSHIIENGIPDGFEFKLNDVLWTDSKIKKVGENAEIPCTRMAFTIDMDERTSEFVQTHGIGEKTGMGFGAVLNKEDIPQRWK